MPEAAPPSEVMLHFYRCKGALLVGEAITSLQAPGFLHSRDKLALFSSRLAVSCRNVFSDACRMSFIYLSCMYIV